MPRLRWVFLALLVVPLADALFLVFVAGQLGWEVTVALVVLTALLGTLFVRAEGRATLKRIQQSMARGDPPTDELVDGGLLIAAGAFLLTPGLITDALGFLLVFPVTRVPFRWAVKKWVIVPTLDSKTGGFASGNVYTFGFPGDDDGGVPGGAFGGAGSGDGDGGPFGNTTTDATDSDDAGFEKDAYDVEFDETDDQ